MKRNTIVSSILMILMCISLIVGSTFAIFTSEATVNIAISSGKVKVNLTIGNLKLYSIPTISEEMIANDSDDNYVLQESTFKNGGTATLDGTNQQLTIDKITPGDKVTFDIVLKNNSTVATLYRVNYALATKNELDGYSELLPESTELVIKIGENVYTAPQTSAEWVELAVNQTETVSVEIKLPASATVQDVNCVFLYNVQAVQGNANTTEIVAYDFFGSTMQ